MAIEKEGPERKGNAKGKKRRLDFLPLRLSISVSIIVFIIYILTLAPGVCWEHHSEDSGDLITAAWVLGIPHPTGYPLFIILGWLWSHVIPIGSVAWRMNLFSAFWGALACGMLVRTVWRSFDLNGRGENISRLLRAEASASAGLLLGFSTYVWQQSVITEVYTLNLFFITLISWILVELLAGAEESSSITSDESQRHWKDKRARLLSLLGLSWGFSLTNHMMALFLFPGILVVLIFGKLGIKRSEILKAAGLWFLPLLLYLYLPIRSAMQPVLDYGDPQTLKGFIWMVTGEQFRKIMFSLVPYQSLYQIMKYYSLPAQIGALGSIAAMLGLIKLLIGETRGALLLAVHTFLLVASALFYLANYAIWDPEGYTLAINVASSIWAGWFMKVVTEFPSGFWRKIITNVVIILVLAMPVIALITHWEQADVSSNRVAIEFGEESFKHFEPNAIVLEVRYERAFALWYYREVEYAKTRPDVAVIYVGHNVYQWGLDILKRKYPDVVVPDKPLTGRFPLIESAIWIIKNNIDKRPIYIGTIIDELKEEGYRFKAVGLMYRVFPPEV